MKPERQPFYAAVTPGLFRGSLPDRQRLPLDYLIDEGVARGRTVEEAACVIANCYHETGRFRFTEEIGKGAGHDYGQPIMIFRGRTDAYFGRGWIQTTFLRNYAKASIKASLHFGREIDFVTNPDLIVQDEAMQAWLVWEGFIMGDWTGENLANHRDAAGKINYFDARSIVNGDERKALKEPVRLFDGTMAETIGALIAGYAREFEAALRLIGEAPPVASACPLGRGDCPRAA